VNSFLVGAIKDTETEACKEIICGKGMTENKSDKAVSRDPGETGFQTNYKPTKKKGVRLPGRPCEL